MTKITPRIASGFPEYLPEDQLEFNRLLTIIRGCYESYGFAPIDTPDLELRNVLLAKFESRGGEIDTQLYDFTRGKNDFVLKFDLTVPLARYVAEHQNDLTFPFKRYQIAKVHRAERAQAGRFREFYQCDIDTIGSESALTDAEFPAVINDIFAKFNFGEFVIRLNDRRILNGFFANLKIADARKVDVMRLIDKVEKISRDEFRDSLREIDLTAEQISRIENLIDIRGTNDEILAQLENLKITDENFATGLKNLREVTAAIRAHGVPENRFAIDLKIARGLDYYTGTVYETFLRDFPSLGSVCSGGRYDDLTGYYTAAKLPGVGISIGLSRLFYQLKQIGVIKASQKSPARVAILPITAAEFAYGLEISRSLRENQIANFLYAEDVPFKKKLQFADKMDFAFAIIIGEDEARSREISLKNLATGESEKVPFADIVEKVR